MQLKCLARALVPGDAGFFHRSQATGLNLRYVCVLTATSTSGRRAPMGTDMYHAQHGRLVVPPESFSEEQGLPTPLFPSRKNKDSQRPYHPRPLYRSLYSHRMKHKVSLYLYSQPLYSPNFFGLNQPFSIVPLPHQVCSRRPASPRTFPESQPLQG